MLDPVMAALVLQALLAAAPHAGGDEARPQSAETPPAAVEAKAATATNSAVPAAPTAAAKEEEFVIPPGFKQKKRGKFIVYCRKETALGTRLQTEKCYDEEGIHEMLRAQAEDREKVDQMRRICGSLDACGAR